MEDRAIVEIGKIEFQRLKSQSKLDDVDFYIENLFPGKDYKMIILEFEQDGESLKYNYVDIENVSSSNNDFYKYAYRKGSSRGGDVTFTTKIGTDIDKKLKTIEEQIFKKFVETNQFYSDVVFFRELKNVFVKNKEKIKKDIEDIVKNSNKDSFGLSFRFRINGEVKYLRDFGLVKDIILKASEEDYYTHSNIQSKAQNKVCSITGKEANEVYGFASPFKYYTPDKPGFISGFFKKEKNWRNYPISKDQTLLFELGERFIREHLNSIFYGHEFILVPRTINPTDTEGLEKIVNLLKEAIIEEKNSSQLKGRIEDIIMKKIAAEQNYFYIDLLFFNEDKTSGAIKIKLLLEEILPSRFRTIFVDIPEQINKKYINENVEFSFEIIKIFFDDKFLDVVQKIFLGEKISREFVFSNFMNVYRIEFKNKKPKAGGHPNLQPLVLEALMLYDFLIFLEILDYNSKTQNMQSENITTEKTFQRIDFENFVNQNKEFFDSDIKIGIFAVGVLVRFLMDIQQSSLNNTPFENKLHGYKINPELLMQIYTEALDKIQKYLKNFYAYSDLREVINDYFLLKSSKLNKLTNNEISFYFVAGLEMGRKFKTKAENFPVD